MYDLPVSLPRARLLQLARLVGVDFFTERFGPAQTAEPELDALRALVAERLDQIAQALVAEASASDDVLDQASATVYLEDRLSAFDDLINDEQAERLRGAFLKLIAGW